MTDWKIWVDTGGTFTDCVGQSPDGRLHRAKVLSSSGLRGTVVRQLDSRRFEVDVKWAAPVDFVRGFQFARLAQDQPITQVTGYDPVAAILELNQPTAGPSDPGTGFEVRSAEPAPILAARLITGTRPDADLPRIDMRLATTRGTNALLERTGAKVALFITRGFGDLLKIGTQQRPDLFALNVRKPEPLYDAVVEVPERLAADGTVLDPLDLDALLPAVEELAARGISTAAVALMHSFRNPRHEEKLSAFLTRHGFRYVSRSSELAPLIRLLPRAETAVVDATLSPVIGEYLDRVRRPLSAGRLHVMTSAGGLVRAEDYRPKDSLLSGPAGGVVGAATAGMHSGFHKAIAFDMGGTSTDVARFDGDYEYVFEHAVGDAHLLSPALAIESVAAGGGSICGFHLGRLYVGPHSAGAQPGPACYGAGGPLTLTDVNLLLGRLAPDRFEIPICADAARQSLSELLAEIEADQGRRPASEQILEGFLEIANERMADAIRKVSVRRGYEPADYGLVAFGGAGGQHACGVADRLGIRTILVPPDASLLSAIGLGRAVMERFSERQVLAPLSEVDDHISGWLNELAEQAVAAVRAEGIHQDEIEIRRRIANLRFVGQDFILTVEFDDDVPLQQVFKARYAAVYGHQPEGRPIEVESLRVIASSKPIDSYTPQSGEPCDKAESVSARPNTTGRLFVSGQWREVPIYERSAIPSDRTLPGPALVFERHTATPVELGWSVTTDAARALMLTRDQQNERAS